MLCFSASCVQGVGLLGFLLQTSHCSSLVLSSLEMALLAGEKPSYGCVKPGPGLNWFPGVLSDIAHDLVKDAKVLGVFPLFWVTRETP